MTGDRRLPVKSGIPVALYPVVIAAHFNYAAITADLQGLDSEPSEFYFLRNCHGEGLINFICS